MNRRAQVAEGMFKMTCVTSLEESRRWLRQFECQRDARYTHPSMRGARDWTASSGKLCIPDAEEVQHRLYEVISFCSVCAPSLLQAVVTEEGLHALCSLITFHKSANDA